MKMDATFKGSCGHGTPGSTQLMNTQMASQLLSWFYEGKANIGGEKQQQLHRE